MVHYNNFNSEMETGNHSKNRAYMMSKLFLIVALLAASIGGYAQKPKYKKIGFSHPDGWFFVTENKKYGFVDVDDNLVVPVIYDNVTEFAGNFARVRKGNKWGFVNRQGKEVVPFVYDALWDFSGNIARCRSGGKVGLIDTTGVEIIPPKYDEIEDFLWGFAHTRNGTRWGAIDMEGKEVLPPLYDKILFDEGLAPIKGNGKAGFIDENYQIAIPAIYDDCTYFSHGTAAVKQNGRWGYIDREGATVLPFTLNYEHHGVFSEGLIPVMQNKKWGFIDASGNVVIPINLNYDEVFGFSEGLARVRKKDKYGYIDRAGKETIKPQFVSASDFENGVAIASKSNSTMKWIEMTAMVGTIASAHATAAAQQYSMDMQAMRMTGTGSGLSLENQRRYQQNQLAIQQRLQNENARAVQNYAGNNPGTVVMLGMIDKNGKELVPFRYGSISLEPVTGNWYLLSHWKLSISGTYDRDIRNRELMPPYSPITVFPPLMFHGLFDIEKKKAVIPAVYTTFDMETFKEKKWVVVSSWNTGLLKGPRYPMGVIDYSGKVIIPLEHDTFDPHIFAPHKRILVGSILDIKPQHNGKYWVTMAASYGVLDHSGKVIIPKMKCEGIELTDNAFVMTTKDGGKKYFDMDGREIRK